MRFLPKVVSVGKMQVVLVPDDRQSLTIEAMVMSGSREEEKEKSGVGHFLEHLSIRGTKKFPGIYAISEAVEGVGGAKNAYTSHDSIGFWTKVDKTKVELAVSSVAQEVCEPLLPADHFEKEKGTILEEIKMYEDDPSSKAFEVQWLNLFGDNGLGRSIAGTLETVSNLTRDDLINYRNKWFLPENILVGVVGNFEEDKMLALIEREFSSLLNKKDTLANKYKFELNNKKKGVVKLVKRKVDQANLSIGFPGVTANNQKRFAVYLMNIILGGSSASILHKEIRGNRGWAYSVGSGAECFMDAGGFFIGGGLRKESLAEAYQLIQEILTGLGDPSSKWVIREDQLKAAKDCYKGRVSLSFDKPERVLSYALGDLTYGREILSAEKVIAEAEKVTLDEVRQVAKEIFDFSQASTCVVGNYKKSPLGT